MNETEEDFRRTFEGVSSSNKGGAGDNTGPSATDKLKEYPEPELDALVEELMGKFAEVQRDKERAKAALEAKRRAQMQARLNAQRAAAGPGGGSGASSNSMSREASQRGPAAVQ